MKKETTMKKLGKEIVNTSLTISKRVQQPFTGADGYIQIEQLPSFCFRNKTVGDKKTRNVEQQSTIVRLPQFEVKEALVGSQVNITGKLSTFISR